MTEIRQKSESIPAKRSSDNRSSAYLSSLFAVFAAASSLKAKEENEGKAQEEGFKLVGPTEFSGLE